jgi:hypothetical protein
MLAHDPYRAQVELLLRSLPAIASAPDFALKGGTAINLFLRDMPRLSVDIDLTYLPVSNRDAALTDIRAQVATIAETLKRTVPGVNIQLRDGDAPKLFVDKSGARIKVEPSVVIRGSLVPTRGTSSTSCIFKQRAPSRIPYGEPLSLISPVTGVRSQSFCSRSANQSKTCSPTTSPE